MWPRWVTTLKCLFKMLFSVNDSLKWRLNEQRLECKSSSFASSYFKLLADQLNVFEQTETIGCCCLSSSDLARLTVMARVIVQSVVLEEAHIKKRKCTYICTHIHAYTHIDTDTRTNVHTHARAEEYAECAWERKREKRQTERKNGERTSEKE